MIFKIFDPYIFTSPVFGSISLEDNSSLWGIRCLDTRALLYENRLIRSKVVVRRLPKVDGKIPKDRVKTEQIIPNTFVTILIQ